LLKADKDFLARLRGFADLKEAFSLSRTRIFIEVPPYQKGHMAMGPRFVIEDKMILRNPNGLEGKPTKKEPQTFDAFETPRGLFGKEHSSPIHCCISGAPANI
jgi:hypothetical protein